MPAAGSRPPRDPRLVGLPRHPQLSSLDPATRGMFDGGLDRGHRAARLRSGRGLLVRPGHPLRAGIHTGPRRSRAVGPGADEVGRRGCCRASARRPPAARTGPLPLSNRSGLQGRAPATARADRHRAQRGLACCVRPAPGSGPAPRASPLSAPGPPALALRSLQPHERQRHASRSERQGRARREARRRASRLLLEAGPYRRSSA